MPRNHSWIVIWPGEWDFGFGTQCVPVHDGLLLMCAFSRPRVAHSSRRAYVLVSDPLAVKAPPRRVWFYGFLNRQFFVHLERFLLNRLYTQWKELICFWAATYLPLGPKHDKTEQTEPFVKPLIKSAGLKWKGEAFFRTWAEVNIQSAELSPEKHHQSYTHTPSPPNSSSMGLLVSHPLTFVTDSLKYCMLITMQGDHHLLQRWDKV